MATVTKNSDLNNFNSSTLVPARLLIGHEQDCVAQVKQFLKQQLCGQTDTHLCSSCHLIDQEQHHSILWFDPEKAYTLELLEPLHTMISYALASQEHYFFILKKADFLTAACANSLLKSLEEPPQGYHFILIAQRQEQILPTIQSRCHIQQISGSAKSVMSSALFTVFSMAESINPHQFLKELESTKMSERESIELLDALLIYWMNQYKKNLIEQNIKQGSRAAQMIMLLQRSMHEPPMPGSSNIFWKNISLRMKSLTAS